MTVVQINSLTPVEWKWKRELEKCMGQKSMSINVHNCARSLATQQKYRG